VIGNLKNLKVLTAQLISSISEALYSASLGVRNEKSRPQSDTILCIFD
jgi:hypothetical protein